MEEEKTFEVEDLEILYNIYGKFFHTVRKETRLDGDVRFFEIDSGEPVDLESYALHGYKMIRDKGMILNSQKAYSLEELREMEEEFEELTPNRRDIGNDFLIELNWIMDSIENQKYDYDRTYPVEQIDYYMNEESL